MEREALVRELIARNDWPAERLHDHQRERLAALLRHAARHSPYYARRLPRDAGAARLDELPTLPKTALIEHFDEIVTDPRLRLGAIEAHLAGERAVAPLHGHRVFSTGGSTGVRGIVVFSAREFAVWVAAFLRAVLGFGIAPGTRVLAIGAPNERHLSKQMFAELATGAPPVSVATPVPQLVATLNAFQPEAIATYPSIAAVLADEQRAGRLHVAPATIATGAEVLTGDMRRRITDAFGIEPQQAYLATEVPVLASSSSRWAGLRLWEDLSLIEVVDERDRPVPPGVPGHKVLVTNLVDHTLPLIRYELSDSVTLAPASGGFRSLARVDGRSEETITLAAADGGDVAVHPFHLHAPFAMLPDVRQYQVTHDVRGLAVAIVVRPGADPAAVARMVRDALGRELEGAGALPPPIGVTPVDAIERDRGSGGKLKLIRSPSA
jgi:phenylacetate-coenzyme A ligase PaaK-like adenylate-forming protein